MVSSDTSTPQRGQRASAKAAWLTTLQKRLRAYWRYRRLPGVPHQNAHIARDIGLTHSDLARLQHQWPSQTTHHPRG